MIRYSSVVEHLTADQGVTNLPTYGTFDTNDYLDVKNTNNILYTIHVLLLTSCVFHPVPVSSKAAQQRQAVQMSQLLPCLLRLRLVADPPISSRHQERQGVLL